MTKAERAARKAAAERMQRAQEEVRAIVAKGACPRCGGKLRRNSSIRGWWQCEQFGAPQFRARPTEPACGWQGFTE